MWVLEVGAYGNATTALGELTAIEVKGLCGRVSAGSTRILRECLARIFHNSGKQIHKGIQNSYTDVGFTRPHAS